MRKVTFKKMMEGYKNAPPFGLTTQAPPGIKDPHSYSYFAINRFWISESAKDVPATGECNVEGIPMLPLVVIEVNENRVSIGFSGRNIQYGIATVSDDTVFYTDIELPEYVFYTTTKVHNYTAGCVMTLRRMVHELEMRKGYQECEYSLILQKPDGSNHYRFNSELESLNIPGLRLEVRLINQITQEPVVLAAYVDTSDRAVGDAWVESVTDWDQWVRRGYPSCYTFDSVGYTVKELETTYWE
jgi:hypothetical protein